MTDSLTPKEILDTTLIVSQFVKISNTERLVGLLVRIEDEEREFSTNVESATPRKKMWYVNQAAKALKKDIKRFVKTRDQSIVGTQVVFDDTFWSTD